jgi:hypothetical protein
MHYACQLLPPVAPMHYACRELLCSKYIEKMSQELRQNMMFSPKSKLFTKENVFVQINRKNMEIFRDFSSSKTFLVNQNQFIWLPKPNFSRPKTFVCQNQFLVPHKVVDQNRIFSPKILLVC